MAKWYLDGRRDKNDRGRMSDKANPTMSEDVVERVGSEASYRADAAFNEMLRIKIQEALDDPRPPMSAEEAFEKIRERAEARRREN